MIYPVYETFQSDSEKHFQFSTQKNVDYVIKLSKASYRFTTKCLSCSDIYEISFHPIGPIKPPPDLFTSLTIKEFIKKYIEVYKSPLLFVCDASDKRQLYRLVLFNEWYLKDKTNTNYLYETREFQFEYYTLYMGILSHISDTDFAEYFEEIDMLGLG